MIIKFWLNVSKEEQKQRFLSRLDEPEKHWKFNEADVAERQLWDQYMRAYEDALQSTSKPWAPWYAIPADDKPFMRMRVAEIICNTMKRLDMHYPTVSKALKEDFDKYRKELLDD